MATGLPVPISQKSIALSFKQEVRLLCPTRALSKANCCETTSIIPRSYPRGPIEPSSNLQMLVTVEITIGSLSMQRF